MSTEWVTVQKALQNWVVACTGMTASKVVWGRQQAPRNAQPGIVMSMMFTGDDGLPWLDAENNPLEITPLAVVVVDDVFTAVAHGRSTGDGPFTIDDAGTYWLIVIDEDTFQVAATFLDAMAVVPVPLTVADDSYTLESTDDTLAAGAEITYKARSLVKAVLTLECYTGVGVGIDMAQAILWRVNAKRLLPTNIEILRSANVGIIEVDRVRAIQGTQDLVLFEPRALVDIKLHFTSEESENGGIIERTEITNEDTGHMWSVPND